MNVHQLAFLNIEEGIKQALEGVGKVGGSNFHDSNGEYIISREDIKEIVKSLLYIRNSIDSLRKYYVPPEPTEEAKKAFEEIREKMYNDPKPDRPCNEIIKEDELEKERAEKPENRYDLSLEGERSPTKEIPIKKWIWLKELLYEVLIPEIKDLNLTPDLSSKEAFPTSDNTKIHVYKPTGRMKYSPRGYEYEYQGTRGK